MACLTDFPFLRSKGPRARDKKGQDAALLPGIEFLELTQHRHPQLSVSEPGAPHSYVFAVDAT